MDGRQTLARCRGFENTLVLTMRDRLVACCPCFETLASLAPQHEVVVFQQVRPHPRVTASPLSLEEATNGSRECAPDDRLRGRLEGWTAIPICDSRYLITIFLRKRVPTLGSSPRACFSGSCSKTAWLHVSIECA